MLKALKSQNLVSLVAGFSLVALLVGGCGTDEETFQKTPVSRNGGNSGTSVPATLATAPPVRETPVTVPEAPQPPREVTYAEAEAAYQARRYAEAQELFERYLDRRPGNPWGHYMLGLAAWKAGNLDSAEESLRRAIALDTTHVKSYVNLARVLLDAGRPGEAFTTVEDALIINDLFADAWRVKGRACHDLGRIDEALAAYRRSIQLDPGDAWSMNNLAFILIQQERFEDAIGPLARAIELRPDAAVFHNNLGMALERTGHPQAAEEAYAAAVSADPSYERAASNGERIAAVLKTPDTAPVDLAERARGFVAELMSWDTPSLATVSETRADPVSTVSPDSTSLTQQ